MTKQAPAIRQQGRTLRDRAEAYERLAELDRLKSDFFSTVSHELRAPLNTIILLSHLIEREGESPADQERRLRDVRVIRDSAETLLRMINNILDLARLEAGQRDLHPQRIEIASFAQADDDETKRWQSGRERTGVSANGRPHRVLIVEDDEASRYGLKSLLESEGFDVSEAGTLAEASRRFLADPPEITVLDITLPDGDGAAWLASLRGQGPLPCPIIALTGVTADEDRRRIERSGAAAVLHKPVNVSMLFEALASCLEESVTP